MSSERRGIPPGTRLGEKRDRDAMAEALHAALEDARFVPPDIPRDYDPEDLAPHIDPSEPVSINLLRLPQRMPELLAYLEHREGWG